MNAPEFIHVKPVKDRRVRMPDGRLLDDEGETVPHSAFWDRRIADRDVTYGKPKRDAATPKSKPAKGTK